MFLTQKGPKHCFSENDLSLTDNKVENVTITNLTREMAQHTLSL